MLFDHRGLVVVWNNYWRKITTCLWYIILTLLWQTLIIIWYDNSTIIYSNGVVSIITRNSISNQEVNVNGIISFSPHFLHTFNHSGISGTGIMMYYDLNYYFKFFLQTENVSFCIFRIQHKMYIVVPKLKICQIYFVVIMKRVNIFIIWN